MINDKEKLAKIEEKTKLLFRPLLITLLAIAIIICAPIGIHFIVPNFSWYWVVFVIVAAFIPMGLIFLTKIASTISPKSKEEKAQAIVKNFKVVLLFWLFDCFYMAAFNKWTVWVYIFGIIAVISVFIDLTKTVLAENNFISVKTYSLLFTLLFGIAITVYMIFIIENENLRTIITTIVAAVYGGLLTLLGVALTIKKGERERKEEEKKKYKPIFTANRILSEGAGITAKKACFSYSDTGELFICSVTMEIDNADKSVFEIKSVFHDNKWWNIAGDYVVLPNRQVIFYFSFNEDVNNLFMRVQDGIGNQYYYEIKVIAINLFPGHQSNNIYAHTVREIKEITLEEIEKRISDLKKTESKEKTDNA